MLLWLTTRYTLAAAPSLPLLAPSTPPHPSPCPPPPAGGSTIFNGVLGQGASRLQEYFTALPGVTPMQPG